MENNKKQTAVEFLVKELNKIIPLNKFDEINNIVSKAIQLEYQQLHDSYMQGCKDEEESNTKNKLNEQ